MQLTTVSGTLPPAAADAVPAAGAIASTRTLAQDVVQFGLLTCMLVLLPGDLLQHERHYLPKELVLTLFGFAAALLALGRARGVRVEAADLCLAGFAALGFAAVAVADNPWLAWRGAALTAATLALFWAVRTFAASGEREPLLAFAVAAVGVVAGMALLEAYGVLHGVSMPNRAPGGTLGNRNRMAHVVVLGLPVVFLYLATARGRTRQAAAAAVLAAASAALVLSRSRAAWLACGAVILFVAALPWIERRGGLRVAVRGWIGVAACVAGAATAVLAPNALRWESESPTLDSLRGLTDYQSGSGRGRVIQYGNTLRMVAAHPVLGVGPGNWAIEYPRYAAPRDPTFDPGAPLPVYRLPQGDWLGYAAERGVPALLLLAAGAALLLLGRRAEDAERDPEARLRRACLAATLLALGIVGTLDPVLMTPAASFLLAVVLGALAAPAARAWTVPLRGGRRIAALAAFSAVAVVFTGLAAARLWAVTRYAPVAGLDGLEQATRIYPGDYQAHLMLAELRVRQGACDQARPHLDAARRLYPTAPYVHQVERQCP
jgi:O-antigen ligase